jgi:predicted ATPase
MGDPTRSRHPPHCRRSRPPSRTPPRHGYQRRVDQADTEIDNLRAAFAWSRENSDTELALTLASALQPLWLSRGRIQEGLNWLGAALADADRDADNRSAARVRASVGRTVLLSFLILVVFRQEQGECGWCAAG